MAVAYDAQSFLDFTSSNSWTHSPSGTPRAVVVMIAHGTVSTDRISGVTYGGVSMTRIATAADTATEAGRVYIYFLGASIPTGNQTVAVTVSAGTEAKTAWCVTGTASGDTTVAAFGVAQENQANPSVTLATPGVFDGLVTNVVYSGLAAPTSLTATSSATKLTGTDTGGKDFGAFVACGSYRNATGASVTSGWTSATDDIAMAAVAVSEKFTGPVSAAVLDDFNRADGGLGSNWTSNILNDGASAGEISSGAIRSVTAGTGGYDSGWWNPATYGPDSEAFITVGSPPTNDIALYLRVASPGTSGVDGYQVVFWAGADTLAIYRVDNGVQTLLGASQTGLATVAAGDMVGATIVGSTITAYRRTTGAWATYGSTRTDSTYTSAGYLGYYIYEGGTRSGLFDGFGGGTVSSDVTVSVTSGAATGNSVTSTPVDTQAVAAAAATGNTVAVTPTCVVAATAGAATAGTTTVGLSTSSSFTVTTGAATADTTTAIPVGAHLAAAGAATSDGAAGVLCDVPVSAGSATASGSATPTNTQIVGFMITPNTQIDPTTLIGPDGTPAVANITQPVATNTAVIAAGGATADGGAVTVTGGGGVTVTVTAAAATAEGGATVPTVTPGVTSGDGTGSGSATPTVSGIVTAGAATADGSAAPANASIVTAGEATAAGGAVEPTGTYIVTAGEATASGSATPTNTQSPGAGDGSGATTASTPTTVIPVTSAAASAETTTVGFSGSSSVTVSPPAGAATADSGAVTPTITIGPTAAGGDAGTVTIGARVLIVTDPGSGTADGSAAPITVLQATAAVAAATGLAVTPVAVIPTAAGGASAATVDVAVLGPTIYTSPFDPPSPGLTVTGRQRITGFDSPSPSLVTAGVPRLRDVAFDPPEPVLEVV